ncbi:nuclease-like protein [Cylindrospermum stagnale PCC 7417]|uniref:Nuclease-like protein n=1 Tax=Cylindrospermum stagnale PCC 7417 TaxID=56107 RepID=K9X6I5_9NOST|nr:nuclease-related domain-containing protein [Cylindrospermum stagnale]AFZ27252.1 nuclease-like protein [Cylindrospermum stagnale PCC 7417]
MINRQENDKRRPSNKIQAAKSIGRLTLAGIITFTVGAFTSLDRYNNYWDKTIFRVQTVDFNILSHTLPTKLSYAITQNQPEEVQRTLDSNYSLFGLIVTDSSGQKIIAYSGKNSDRSSSWKAALNPEKLKNHSYDLLLDPPPVFSQWTYSNSHAINRTATNLTNKGRVIGRVYYVRGVRPTFQDDFSNWLSNPLSESSRIQTYTMTLLACVTGGLAIWTFLEYILYKKRVSEAKAKEREQTLKDYNKALAIQLAERINELTLSQNQREREKSELIRDTNKVRNQNNKLYQEISQLKESLNRLPKNAEDLMPLQAELEKTRLEAEQNLNKQKQYQQNIGQLNERLRLAQKKQLEATESNEIKENELAQLQKQIQDIENSRSLAESELEELRSNEKGSQKIITVLEQKLYNQILVQEQLNTQLELLQNSLLESQQREQELAQREKQTQAELEILGEEIERIKEDEGRHPLNNFEVSIKNTLEQHFSSERVLTQFDVGTGKQGSKFTDFIIVMNKCCIVIEAKSYQGTITSVGNPRNTGWTCNTGTRKLYIYACWGENPYQQVKTYADSLYQYVKSSNRNRFPVYGVVVFPANSDIDNDIESNIGGFYRVTTLNNLITVIEQLDNQSHLQNARTYQQILQRLNGVPNQQAA